MSTEETKFPDNLDEIQPRNLRSQLRTFFNKKKKKWYYDITFFAGKDKGDRVFYDLNDTFKGFDTEQLAIKHALTSL